MKMTHEQKIDHLDKIRKFEEDEDWQINIPLLRKGHDIKCLYLYLLGWM